MLEKALISGVVHQREETVYHVEGVTRARLFGALAEALVNVDTIVQTGAEIVFSAPRRGSRRRLPRARRARLDWTSRDDLGKVSLVGAGMKSHPGVAAKTFATLEAAGIEAPIVSTSPIKIACHVPTRRRRPRRPGAPRGVRAWPLTARIGVVGATGAVGTITLALLRERGYRDVRVFASAAIGRAGGSAGTLVEEATPEALAPATSTSASSRSARPRAASSFRTPSAAARSASTSRRPTGSSPASRSSCPR